ncbi:MAG: hypothetical protein LC808_39740, partial [Actinobacteria bacterium]|nr:hypothetical protein [Actinomycetota bacterium]
SSPVASISATSGAQVADRGGGAWQRGRGVRGSRSGRRHPLRTLGGQHEISSNAAPSVSLASGDTDRVAPPAVRDLPAYLAHPRRGAMADGISGYRLRPYRHHRDTLARWRAGPLWEGQRDRSADGRP